MADGQQGAGDQEKTRNMADNVQKYDSIVDRYQGIGRLQENL